MRRRVALWLLAVGLAAHALAEHRIGAIIYVPEGNEWGSEVERGMRDAVSGTGAELTVRRHAFELARETALIGEFIESGVDAIVFPAVQELSSICLLYTSDAADE